MNEFDKKVMELDEQLAKLKAMDIKEISQTTRLTTNKIQDILEKRFDNIDRMRAKGFLTILEREYKLDLSMWLEEYTRYFAPSIKTPQSLQSGALTDLNIKQESLDSQTSQDSQKSQNLDFENQENKKNEQTKQATKDLDSEKTANKEKQQEQNNEPKIYAIPDIQNSQNVQSSQTQTQSVQSLKLPQKESEKQNSEFKKEDKAKSNIALFAALIVAAVGIAGYFGVRVFGSKADSVEQQIVAIQNTPEPAQDEPVIITQPNDGAYDGIFIDADSVSGAVSIVSVMNSQDAVNEHKKMDLESQTSQQKQQNSVDSENLANLNTANIVNTENMLNTTQSIFPQNNQTTKKLAITPNSELWVGVIDTKTQRSTHKVIKITTEFDLDKPQIFVFGHGDFQASVDGNIAPHKSRQFVRMYFDGNNVEEINYARYKQLYPNEKW